VVDVSIRSALSKAVSPEVVGSFCVCCPSSTAFSADTGSIFASNSTASDVILTSGVVISVPGADINVFGAASDVILISCFTSGVVISVSGPASDVILTSCLTSVKSGSWTVSSLTNFGDSSFVVDKRTVSSMCVFSVVSNAFVIIDDFNIPLTLFCRLSRE
jgi:hypothetical protein